MSARKRSWNGYGCCQSRSRVAKCAQGLLLRDRKFVPKTVMEVALPKPTTLGDTDETVGRGSARAHTRPSRRQSRVCKSRLQSSKQAACMPSHHHRITRATFLPVITFATISGRRRDQRSRFHTLPSSQ